MSPSTLLTIRSCPGMSCGFGPIGVLRGLASEYGRQHQLGGLYGLSDVQPQILEYALITPSLDTTSCVPASKVLEGLNGASSTTVVTLAELPVIERSIILFNGSR